jgi:hypothetical protein
VLTIETSAWHPAERLTSKEAIARYLEAGTKTGGGALGRTAAERPECPSLSGQGLENAQTGKG